MSTDATTTETAAPVDAEAAPAVEQISDSTQKAQRLTNFWIESQVTVASEKAQTTPPEKLSEQDRAFGLLAKIQSGASSEIPLVGVDDVRCEWDPDTDKQVFTSTGTRIESITVLGDGNVACMMENGTQRTIPQSDLQQIIIASESRIILEAAEKAGVQDVVQTTLQGAESPVTPAQIESMANRQKFVSREALQKLMTDMNLEPETRAQIETWLTADFANPSEMARFINESGFFTLSLTELDTQIQSAKAQAATNPEAPQLVTLLEAKKTQIQEQVKFLQANGGVERIFNKLSGDQYEQFVSVLIKNDPEKAMQTLLSQLSEQQKEEWGFLLKGAAGGGIISALLILMLWMQGEKQ